jgi:hypothetical protein
MNKHVSGAEREAASSAKETQAREFDAMTWGAEGALKAMAAYQVESLRFIARRTCCNLELMRRLCRCGNWQEIAQAQQSWFKDCAADYGEELSRLASTGFQLAQSDFAPLQGLMYCQPGAAKGDRARGRD